ncbi:MAG: endonuclease/exonuclease/phosphatase family protein [Angustibacter sp.]
MATSFDLVTLNVRGMPLWRNELPGRLTAIARYFEASSVAAVAFQEVHTYGHLFQLTRHMPSFAVASYRPSVLGPAGGLLTMTRTEVQATAYRRFAAPLTPGAARGLPLRARATAGLRGILLTRLSGPNLTIVNTHPSPNRDGDWAPTNRHTPLHRQQLVRLAEVVRSVGGAVVVCGDFNVAADSPLHREFLAATGLSDPFASWDPPTFRSEYLPTDRTPHRIDFILTAGSIAACEPRLVLKERIPLDSGRRQVHTSDHLGLQVSLASGA